MTTHADYHLGAPCPQCGCCMRGYFNCNCGEVHSAVCENCGRFSDLSLVEFPVDPDHKLALLGARRCENGETLHIHEFDDELCAKAVANFYSGRK